MICLAGHTLLVFLDCYCFDYPELYIEVELYRLEEVASSRELKDRLVEPLVLAAAHKVDRAEAE